MSDKLQAHNIKIIVPPMSSGIKRMKPAQMVKRFDGLPKNAPTYLVLGVPFRGPYDGKDAHGEYFFEATDIRANVGDEIPLTFYHGLGPDSPFQLQDPPEFIGAGVLLGQAELDQAHAGFWYLARLDPEAKLATMVAEAETKELRASSGAIQYLTRKTQDGAIYVYPIGELAIFSTNSFRQPANDYAIAVDFGTAEADAVIAQFGDDAKAIIAKAFEPVEETVEADAGAEEADETGAKTATGAKSNSETEPEVKMEGNKVDEMLANFDARLQEIQAFMQKAQTGNLADEVAKRLAEKYRFVNQEGKALLPDQTAEGMKAKTDDVAVFESWASTGKFSAGAKALTETGDGEALVPREYADEIAKKVAERSIFTRFGLYSKRTVRSRLSLWPRMSYSDRATTFDTTTGVGEHNPTSDLVQVTLANIGYLVKVERTLTVDNPRVWGDVVLGDTANAFAAAENYYLTIGSGVNEPRGIATATTNTVDLANADHIEPDDLLKLMYKVLPADYATNAVWLMHPETAYYIAQMKDTTGRYLWLPSLAAGQPSQLLARPVYLSSYMPKLSDGAGAKVIVLFDPGYYYYFAHPNIFAARLTEHFLTNGFIGYLSVVRYDARLMNADAAAALTVPAV